MSINVKKIIYFLVRCFSIQLGFELVINTNTGGDSAVILIRGISNTLHITAGLANRMFLFYY